MHFSELKQLAKRLGGIVVLNGDRPELVVLSYNNYRQLADGLVTPEAGHTLAAEEGAEIERLNQEILALKEEIRQKEEAELAAETNPAVDLTG